jgi:hypothetical protein
LYHNIKLGYKHKRAGRKVLEVKYFITLSAHIKINSDFLAMEAFANKVIVG